MAVPNADRSLIISSRLSEGYQLSELGLKNLQHVFTVWFPRAIYGDLTDDTVRVDVLVRMGRTTGRGVYATSFLRGDGSVVKKIEYDEDRLVGRVCENYDQRRSGYCGKKEGLDYRIVVYSAGAGDYRSPLIRALDSQWRMQSSPSREDARIRHPLSFNIAVSAAVHGRRNAVGRHRGVAVTAGVNRP